MDFVKFSFVCQFVCIKTSAFGRARRINRDEAIPIGRRLNYPSPIPYRQTCQLDGLGDVLGAF